MSFDALTRCRRQPRNRRAAIAAILVAVATGLIADSASAATTIAATQDLSRYNIVKGCYALRAPNGSYLVQTPTGYTASAASTAVAERFRMQATDLGRYLFYGLDSDFLALSAGSGVAAAANPSNNSDWTVKPSGGADSFEITNSFAGRDLGVDGSGGLVSVAPGSAASFQFVPADGCAVYPEIETNTTGTPYRSHPGYGETHGYIDGHMHLMTFEFLGGDAHCGRPWHRFGVEYALVDCPDHIATGGCGAILESALGGDTCHDTGGWPTFAGWPKPESLTHEGSYYRWIERSWMAGQRIFVNLLVENRVLCELYPIKHNSCNEMDSVLLQAKRTQELEDYIDAQSGGPGKGWFRIVRNPFQARRVINRGKLAVVMGMEVSEPFDCKIRDGIPQCDEAGISYWLDRLQKLGIRQLELSNKFDNALGGVAGDGGATGVLTNNGNKYATGRYWDLEHCDDANTGDHDNSPIAPTHPEDAVIGNGFGALLPPGGAPVYPPPPHCNRYGLSPLGRYAVQGLIKRHLIFDPDHLSVYARDAALDVVDANHYPGVMSSHSWSTPRAERRIYRDSGIITVRASGSQRMVDDWRVLRRQSPGRFGRQYWGIGWGADMNGFGGQSDPRGADVENPVTYPFKSWDGGVTIDQQVSGEKVYDINTDGVAHYGLYADWVEDLRQIAGKKIIREMTRGPEAYLQMWERAYGVPRVRCASWSDDFSEDGLGGGMLRLDATTKRTLYSAGQPVDRHRTWRWCTRNNKAGKRKLGGRRSIVGVFDERRKLGLIVSTLQRNRALGVGRGAPVRKLRAIADPIGHGIYIRRQSPDRTVIWGTKRGKVRFTALAGERVGRGPVVIDRYLRRAGFDVR